MLVLTRRITHFPKRAKFYSIYAPRNILNDDHILQTVGRLKTAQPLLPISPEPAKRAAVLIPLCVVDHQVSLMYTLRTSHLRTHKGQVSFPGGMEDEEDPTLEYTALRETQEELGIDPDDVKIWGRGSLIFARGRCVLPVIGQIMGDFDEAALKINQHEVEEVFTVTLKDLCDPENNRHTQFRTGYSAPVFLGGRRRIWGLTALITNAFLKALLPHEGYQHRIKYIPSISFES